MKKLEFNIPDPKGSELTDLHKQVLKLIKKYGKNPICAEVLGNMLAQVAQRLRE